MPLLFDAAILATIISPYKRPKVVVKVDIGTLQYLFATIVESEPSQVARDYVKDPSFF